MAAKAEGRMVPRSAQRCRESLDGGDRQSSLTKVDLQRARWGNMDR